MAEFRRTLHTSDGGQARLRALHATVWFKKTMQRFVDVPSLTRADLERAALAFFAELAEETDRPRQFHPIHTDEDIDHQVEESRKRASDLFDQLKSNVFDHRVGFNAREVASRAIDAERTKSAIH